jgi:hypothetical protein
VPPTVTLDPTVVAFDDQVDLVLPLAHHDADHVAERVLALRPGGSTNLSDGEANWDHGSSKRLHSTNRTQSKGRRSRYDDPSDD